MSVVIFDLEAECEICLDKVSVVDQDSTMIEVSVVVYFLTQQCIGAESTLIILLRSYSIYIYIYTYIYIYVHTHKMNIYIAYRKFSQISDTFY